MSVFVVPPNSKRLEFSQRVVSWVPGGKHIAPHVDAGPWRFVVLEGLERGVTLVTGIQEAYPSAALPVLNPSYASRVASESVYLLPEYPYQVMCADWADEMVDSDLFELSQYPAQPDDLDALVPGLLVDLLPVAEVGDEFGQFADAILELCEVFGAEKVIEKIVNDGEHKWYEAELRTHMLAWHAAACV